MRVQHNASPLFIHSVMGWRLEAASSSDVAQRATALWRQARHFAISATSVEYNGLSHIYVFLLTTVVTTRVWIDSLYHVKPTK